jgi:cyclopropane fatty-acyl-phospholipid synthase-like methyltransferase
VQYEKMRLQDMDYKALFDGAICIDAMEHIPPEDWPLIMQKFQGALKPDGWLYFTVVMANEVDLQQAYKRAKGRRLPVQIGELADEVEEAYEQTMRLSPEDAEEADEAAYHYCPPLEQVRAWIGGAGLAIEDEGAGNWYAHFIVQKR